MSKLFLITLRWMKKDRRRTVLSFVSVMLAVYMMSVLGIYFSSAVSFLRSKEKFENGDYHVRFHCDLPQQAEKISHNAAVSNSCTVFDCGYGFVSEYLSKYKTVSPQASEFNIPTFTANGKEAISEGDVSFVSGDTSMIAGGELLKKGRMPEQAGEVTLSEWSAKRYGDLDVGDTVVFRYEVRKARVTYSQYTEQMLPDPNDPNIISNQKVYSQKDATEESALIVNSFITQINSVYEQQDVSSKDKYHNSLQELVYLFNISDKIEEKTYHNNGYPLPTDFGEKQEYLEVNAETFGEPFDVIEYKAKVVGLSGPSSDTSCYLWHDDEQAKKLFPVEDGRCYVRISDGLDVDNETEQIKKTVGLPDTYKVGDGSADTAALNNMLLFYEGRSLYNPRSSDPMIMLGVFAVILAVFVFFARLIINNAFELSSAYRMSQYCSLKTVGVSRGQMFVMVLGECLIYLFAALPIAILLAFATGKLIISEIMDLKILDALYGSGVTDRFFKIEISPTIMAITLAITAFSVFLSAYAVAIRMIKMPAVQTRTADGTKPPRAVKRSWRTKRLFGISAGLAVRNAFRKKMRFFITMLAAIVSSTLVVAIAALIYAVDKSDNSVYDPDAPDFEGTIESRFDDTSNLSEDYLKIKNSGLFKEVDLMNMYLSCSDDKGNWDTSFAGDKMKKEKLTVIINLVGQDRYEYINTDISYDELVRKGGVLACSKAYRFDKGNYYEEDFDALKENTKRITLKIDSYSQQVQTKDLTLDVCGTYTVGSAYKAHEFYSDSSHIALIVPIENFYKLFSWLDKGAYGEVESYSNLSYLGASLFDLDISLVAQDGRQLEAKQFLVDNFTNRLFLDDHVSEKQTLERTSKALRIAGLSLAAIVFAVAMINVASTSAAEMVNRRRELSMLRACGMSLRQIFTTLRTEVLFYSAVSAGISSVLGTAIAAAVYKLIDERAEMAPLPFSAVIAVFLLMTVIMLCSYLLPLRNMSRSQIAQDIRMKE